MNAAHPLAGPSFSQTGWSSKGLDVVDADGRTITLKKPAILSSYRLIESLGDTARNQTYMAMVIPLLCVHKVDGVVIAPVRTRTEIEALVELLGESGMEVLMRTIAQQMEERQQAATASETAARH